MEIKFLDVFDCVNIRHNTIPLSIVQDHLQIVSACQQISIRVHGSFQVDVVVGCDVVSLRYGDGITHGPFQTIPLNLAWYGS